MVEILKFGQDSEIWSRFWNLVEILEFRRNSEGYVIQNSESVGESVSKEGIELLSARAAKKSSIHLFIERLRANFTIYQIH